MADLLEVLNTVAPVNRLPPELLSSALIHLGWTDRFRAAMVCRRWNTSVLRDPTLWRDVSVMTFSHAYFLERCPEMLLCILALSRSSDLSLSLDLELPVSIDSAIVLCNQNGAFRAHLSRCVELDLRISLELKEEVINILFDSLCQGMPRLRTLCLMTLSSVLESLANGRAESRMLSGGAPNLALVKLEVAQPWLLFGNSTFPTVTGLALHLEHGLSETSLRSALAIFPSVTNLVLSVNEYFDNPSFDWTLALPGRLEHLGIEANTAPTFLCRLAHSLKRHNIAHVWIADPIVSEAAEAAMLLEAWVATSPAIITSLRIDHVDRDSPEDVSDTSPFAKWKEDNLADVNIYMWSSNDPANLGQHPCCAMLRSPANFTPLYCASLILRLTHLSLDETLFTVYPDFPTLPDLEVLTIGILEPRAQQHAHSGIFFLLPEEINEYPLPALRMLKLAVAWHDTDECKTRIAPEVVREFIENHIHYNAPCLDKLVLHGVHIVETIPTEVAALLVHFKDVAWEWPRIVPGSTPPMSDLWFD